MQRPTTPSSRPHTPTLVPTRPETPRTASKSILSETLLQPKSPVARLPIDSDDELEDDEKVVIIKGLRAENVQLIQKVQDMNERMKKNDVQTDLIRAQLLRRNQLLTDQRKNYFKELRTLREQLFQKDRLGDYYQAEDWGSYFDLEEMNPDAGSSAAGKGSGQGGSDASNEATQKKIALMTKDFEAQKMKITIQYQNQVRELQGTADRLTKELDQKQKDMERRENEMKAAHEAEIDTINQAHVLKVQEMESSFAAERQAMQEEKERALAELASEYEAKLAAAAKQLEEVSARFQAEIAALKKEIAAKQSEIEDLRRRIDEAMEEIERAKAAMQEFMAEKERLERQVQEQAKKIKEQEAASASHRAEMEKMKLHNEDLMKQLAEALSNSKKQAEMDAELDVLRKDNDSLRKQLEDLRTSTSLPTTARDQIEVAIKRDDELRQEKTDTNWKLLSEGAKREANVRKKPVAVKSHVPGLALDEEEKSRKKFISHLSVFDRLEQRAILAMDKLRNRRLLLEQERRRNMERVLMAVCLLVKPQPTVMKAYPIANVNLNLATSPSGPGSPYPSSPYPAEITTLDVTLSSPSPALHRSATSLGRMNTRTPRGHSLTPRSQTATPSMMSQMMNSQPAPPSTPRTPRTPRVTAVGRPRATVTAQGISYHMDQSPTPTSSPPHYPPAKPDSVEPFMPTSYVPPKAMPPSPGRPASARLSIQLPATSTYSWSDTLMDASPQTESTPYAQRPHSALDYAPTSRGAPLRASLQRSPQVQASPRSEFLSMNRVERREAILSMIYPDRRQPVSRLRPSSAMDK